MLMCISSNAKFYFFREPVTETIFWLTGPKAAFRVQPI